MHFHLKFSDIEKSEKNICELKKEIANIELPYFEKMAIKSK